MMIPYHQYDTTYGTHHHQAAAAAAAAGHHHAATHPSAAAAAAAAMFPAAGTGGGATGTTGHHHVHHHHHHGLASTGSVVGSPYGVHQGGPGGVPESGEVPKYARLLFKLPRVVPNQREKFETEDLFKKHAREGEVRYTLYRDRPVHERQAKFQAGCRDGHTEISFSGSGLVVLLNWMTGSDPRGGGLEAKYQPHLHQMNQHQVHQQHLHLQQNALHQPNSSSYCDFNREHGKVHIRSSFILNGVCVRWRGWLDLERLDGAGCLELDEELMYHEENNLQKHIQLVQQRIRECEDRYRTGTDLQMRKVAGYV